MFALEAAATDSTLDIAIMIFNPNKPYWMLHFAE